jgi:hypothetical protein
MSSDTEQPRQRTVAELLAEHGGGVPTGRRRRRRADESVAAVEPDPMPVVASAASATTTAAARPESGERAAGDSALAVAVASVWDLPSVGSDAPAGSDSPAGYEAPEAVPGEPAAAARPVSISASMSAEPAAPVSTFAESVFGSAPAGPGRPVDWPTEQIPLIGGTYPRDVEAGDVEARDVGTRDAGNGPIGRLRRASPKWRDALDAVERSERELRTGSDSETGNGSGNGHAPARPPAAQDELDDGGGPPTRAAPLDPDFRAPAGLDPADFEPADPERALHQQADAEPADAEPADLDHRYGGRFDEQLLAGDQDDRVLEPDLVPRRRLGRAAAEAAAGPGWPVVLAQWIGGALGGAALWIGFRFLWRSLPVVAFAAAILITIGLVLLVRALLRNEGRRTTVFVVLVGLLLTVSPAILVLLDR